MIIAANPGKFPWKKVFSCGPFIISILTFATQTKPTTILKTK